MVNAIAACMSEVISRHIVIFFVISFWFAVGHTREPSLFVGNDHMGGL
jgi:hypothetical protein